MAGDIAADFQDAGAPAAPARWAVRFRMVIAGVALIAWMLITTSSPFQVHASDGLIGAVADGPQWGILFAGLFLVGLAGLCRWGDLGLNAPVPPKSLLLLWLPAIYILAFAALDVAAGPPPLVMVGFLLLNVTLGAFSEEMMFRGVLLGALRTRLRPVAAIAIAAVLFGLAHLVNAALLGSVKIAMAQAVAAAMSGVVFTAIRLRTGSLLPAIAFHALWDFTTLMAIARRLGTAGAATGAGAIAGAPGGGDPSLAMLAAPIVLLLPNFLYALFLLRPRKPKGRA